MNPNGEAGPELDGTQATKRLYLRAVRGFLQTLVLLVAAVFLPVWTLHYWQGWACLAAFVVPAAIISVRVAKSDPALLERRMKATAKEEKQAGQKVVQITMSVVFFGSFVLSAFDHRFGWSRVPGWASMAADATMVASMIVLDRVMRANSFASGNIEVADDQKVISTGPYAWVRHPMYTGGILLLVGIPVALGSWWALLLEVPMIGGVVWRLLDEEKFLSRNLAGYTEYLGRVKYRLVPGVW